MGILINILSILLIVIFIRYQFVKRNSYFQLGILFSVSLFLNYPLRLLSIQFTDNITSDFPVELLRANIIELSLLSLLGIGFFIFGYVVADQNKKNYIYLDSGTVHVSNSSFHLLWYLLFISVSGKLIKIFTGNYISFLLADDLDYRYANIVENMHMMGWICFAGIYFIYFKYGLSRLSHYILIFSVSAIQLLYQVFQGSKTFLTLPFVILSIAYYHARKKIPYAFVVITLVWFILFVFPFVTSFREVMARSYAGIPGYSEFEIVHILKETYKESFLTAKGNGLSDYLSASIFRGLSRFAGADELYRMTSLVPDFIPYKYGKDFLATVFTLIPRAIWPDKPIFSPGAEYGHKLGSIAAVTPFPLGTMFWDFGYIGITAGMFVWGVCLSVLMRAVLRFYRTEEFRLFVTAALISEAYWLTTGESVLPIVIASTIKIVIIYAAVIWVFKIISLESTCIRRGNARRVQES